MKLFIKVHTMRVKILQKSFMAEWQNKSFPEFLSSATREPPRTWSAGNGPPKYEGPPRYVFRFLAPQGFWRFLRLGPPKYLGGIYHVLLAIVAPNGNLTRHEFELQ